MQAALGFVLQGHPSAKVRSLSSVYDCMGMVFASRRTAIQPEHLDRILKDDKYTLLSDRSEIQRGDLIVYRDDKGAVSHVGIVANVAIGLEDKPIQVRVLSQWGADGEYFHLADDVHQALGKPAEYWTDRV